MQWVFCFCLNNILPLILCCLGNHPSTEPALSHKWCGEEVCLDREQCELFSSFPTSIRGLSMPYKVNRNLRVQLEKNTWFQRLRKMRPLPTTASQGKSHPIVECT